MAGKNKGKYSLHIMVNGVDIGAFNLTREHDADTFEGCTLSGHALVRLTPNDVITAFLQVDAGGKKYQIDPNKFFMTVKLERRW